VRLLSGLFSSAGVKGCWNSQIAGWARGSSASCLGCFILRPQNGPKAAPDGCPRGRD
jgi:hypothetical protein